MATGKQPGWTYPDNTDKKTSSEITDDIKQKKVRRSLRSVIEETNEISRVSTKTDYITVHNKDITSIDLDVIIHNSPINGFTHREFAVNQALQKTACYLVSAVAVFKDEDIIDDIIYGNLMPVLNFILKDQDMANEMYNIFRYTSKIVSENEIAYNLLNSIGTIELDDDVDAGGCVYVNLCLPVFRIDNDLNLSNEISRLQVGVEYDVNKIYSLMRYIGDLSESTTDIMFIVNDNILQMKNGRIQKSARKMY